MEYVSRRGVLVGVASLLAAPAIVRAENIMKISDPFISGIKFYAYPYPEYHDKILNIPSTLWVQIMENRDWFRSDGKTTRFRLSEYSETIRYQTKTLGFESYKVLW